MGSCTGKKPLIILIIIIIVLLLSVLWSVNKVGGYVGSVSIPKAYLCKEIQQNITPVPFTENLYPDQKQVCIWFEYERAKSGDKIKISCYKDKELISEQFATLTTKNGVRAFYLMRSDGTTLPLGKYRVVLSSSTKVWYEFAFEVVPKPKPAVIKTINAKNAKKSKIKTGGTKGGKNKKSYSRREQRRSSGRHRSYRRRRHR